ncbi:MAG: hypothetical protein ACYDGY_09230 [Acidimicrobiales bacterium]
MRRVVHLPVAPLDTSVTCHGGAAGNGTTEMEMCRQEMYSVGGFA